MSFGTYWAFGRLIAGSVNGARNVGWRLAWLIGLPFKLLEIFLQVGWDLSRRKSFDTAVAAIVTPHLPVLAKKRHTLLRADDYGIVQKEKWFKELDYFFDNVLLPQLGKRADYAERNIGYTAKLVNKLICSYQLDRR